MKHKRKRPKHRRAGCLFCKPWKASPNCKQRRRSTKAGNMVRRHEARANVSAREQGA